MCSLEDRRQRPTLLLHISRTKVEAFIHSVNSFIGLYVCNSCSGVARGGLRGLEHPPLRWSEYAVNGSGQQAATA